MTNVDQFESVFRAAAKEVYSYAPVAIRRILQLTDLEGPEAELFHARVRGFLQVLGDDPAWVEVGPGDFETISDLLAIVEREEPDLVCTYRNLASSAWRWPYSLGEHLDVMTQIAPCPVLVLPHPLAGRAYDHALEDTDAVMAVTDHLAGDSRLVDHAVHFTQSGGKLFLTHIEDEAALERMLDLISKIPSINTEDARKEIRARLLKEPEDYVASCRSALEKAELHLSTEGIVVIGNELSRYKQLIAEQAIDLLVFHTRDQDQLAMHGRAYTLAVEFRGIPLLML